MAKSTKGEAHGEHQLGAALREMVMEKLAEKAAQKRGASTAKGRLQAEAIEAIGQQLGALDVWTRVPSGGRKPQLRRDDLAAAAVRIADAEGIDALSMRRLASELGVGTMSLYHYVETKDELLTLLVDTVMSEVVVPESDPLPSDWREALSVLAHRSLDAMKRHPWMLDIADDPPIGPNSVRHFDQTLQAVSSLDIPLAERVDIVALVDEYAFGYALMARNNAADTAGWTREDEVVEYLTALLDTGAYPQLEQMVAEVGVRSYWEQIRRALDDPGRFQRNLDRVLDGIDAHLPHRPK